ncbi:MAG TPA: S41 family peptidase [Pyrinomonadaceae bacterium]|nr:S41 family peptidase [Pyrinomonadaceae bacterium]
MKISRAALMLALLAFCMLADPNAVPARAQQPKGPRPPEQPDMSIDAAARREVLDTLAKRLDEAYVFPDVAAKMEQALRSHEAEYAQITSARQFAERLTADLQAVSHDKHLRVRYSHEPIPARPEGQREPSAEEREQFRREMARINYGFTKVERLPGNIGYVEFKGFLDPEGGADTVASVFNFLGNTDAIIFDLRENGGGDPAMVALICSYLFGPEPVHLNDLHWRDGKGERVDEFWTRKEVAGRRYTGKDVYVLTSNYTFSGAEEFTNNLKALKRATIVGETTGGGANPGGGNRLSEHFGAFIPTGRAVNPITKTNWEGTGVEPDVKVPADQALHIAQLAALKKAADASKDENIKGGILQRIDELQKELNDMQSKQAASTQK